MSRFIPMILCGLATVGVAAAAEATFNPTPAPVTAPSLAPKIRVTWPTPAPKICAIVHCRVAVATPQPILPLGSYARSAVGPEDDFMVGLLDDVAADPVPPFRISSLSVRFRKITESRERYGLLHSYVDIVFVNGNHLSMSFYAAGPPVVPRDYYDVSCVFNAEPANDISSLSFVLRPTHFYYHSAYQPGTAQVTLLQWRQKGFMPSQLDRAIRMLGASLIMSCGDSAFAAAAPHLVRNSAVDNSGRQKSHPHLDMQKEGIDNAMLVRLLESAGQPWDAQRVQRTLALAPVHALVAPSGSLLARWTFEDGIGGTRVRNELWFAGSSIIHLELGPNQWWKREEIKLPDVRCVRDRNDSGVLYVEIWGDRHRKAGQIRQSDRDGYTSTHLVTGLYFNDAAARKNASNRLRSLWRESQGLDEELESLSCQLM